MTERKSRRMRPLVAVTALLLVLYAFGEIASLRLIRNGSVRLQMPRRDVSLGPEYWADCNPDFGIWHLTNRTMRVRAACYDVTYRSNSHGARDPERALAATNRHRVVVLGDSFVEGMGVNEEDRFSNWLERRTAVEHLNFGTSGTCSPLQEMLIYDKLASRFEHDAVILAILPANDFYENALAAGKTLFTDRYRPYWAGAGQWTYYRERLAESEWSPAYADARRFEPQFVLKKWLQAHSAFYRMLELMALKQTSVGWFRQRVQAGGGGTPFSWYYDCTPDEMATLGEVLGAAFDRFAGKRVAVITIPIGPDFQRFGQDPAPPLAAYLQTLCESRGVQYLDLLPLMATNRTDSSAYFLPCDGHWTPEANALVGEFLWNKLDYYSELRGR